MYSGQYLIDELPFRFTSFILTIPEIQLFRNLTLKNPRSMSWVRSKVKVTHSSPSIQPMHFLLSLCKLDQPFLRYGQYTSEILKNRKGKISYRFSPKSNQVIGMSRWIQLPIFVVIGWVVLILFCRWANFSSSMPKPWLGSRSRNGHPLRFLVKQHIC